MKAKDLFALAVRLLGLLFLYHGLQALLPAISQIIDSFPHDVGEGTRMSGSFGHFIGRVVMVAWPLVVAYWLVRGAPFIIRTAYPNDSASMKEDTQIGGAVGQKTDV